MVHQDGRVLLRVVHPPGSAGTSMCNWAKAQERLSLNGFIRLNNCNIDGLSPREDYRRHPPMETCEDVTAFLHEADVTYFQSERPYPTVWNCTRPTVISAVLVREPMSRGRSICEKGGNFSLCSDSRVPANLVTQMLAGLSERVSPTEADLETAIAALPNLYMLDLHSLAEDVYRLETKVGLPHVPLPHANDHGEEHCNDPGVARCKRENQTRLPGDKKPTFNADHFRSRNLLDLQLYPAMLEQHRRQRLLEQPVAPPGAPPLPAPPAPPSPPPPERFAGLEVVFINAALLLWALLGYRVWTVRVAMKERRGEVEAGSIGTNEYVGTELVRARSIYRT